VSGLLIARAEFTQIKKGNALASETVMDSATIAR